MMKQKIINTHPTFHFTDDINRICEPLKLLNIDYFSHVIVDKKNQFSALGMEPEFAKLYLMKDYYRFDIHMAQLNQTESYILWDNVQVSNETKALNDDFMDFNHGHTFTICQKHSNYSEYFHFATKRGDEYMNQQYLLNLNSLHQFIYHFREKVNASQDLRKAYDIKLSLPQDKSGYHTTSPISLIPAERFSQETENKRIYIDQNTYLTLKELECLGHLASGKIFQEIAIIMGISHRTAKAHIENIRTKLDCKNLFQLGLKYSSIKK